MNFSPRCVAFSYTSHPSTCHTCTYTFARSFCCRWLKITFFFLLLFFLRLFRPQVFREQTKKKAKEKWKEKEIKIDTLFIGCSTCLIPRIMRYDECEHFAPFYHSNVHHNFQLSQIEMKQKQMTFIDGKMWNDRIKRVPLLLLLHLFTCPAHTGTCVIFNVLKTRPAFCLFFFY